MVVGATATVLVVAPVFHEKLVADPEAVKVVLFPTHTVVPPETATVGKGLTVTLYTAVFEHVPEKPVILTLVLVVGEINKVGVVAPVLQE